MAKKMVCPIQIIVFQKLRSFFTFSGPKLSYNYRIIVHLATLIHKVVTYSFTYSFPYSWHKLILQSHSNQSKSAGPAYMHASHNFNCGTNRTQAHPHHTKQCTFCTHFTFPLTISTFTPILLKFVDPLHKKVPDQHICMHPTISSVVPIEPRHIPTIQNTALFALISHSHSP